MKAKQDIEERRLVLQNQLDSEKTPLDRNRMGQFATPSELAGHIVAFAVSHLPKSESIRFLDPAIGTGSFYAALQRCAPRKRIADALGFEIDPHYGNPARELWSGQPLDIRLQDFTRATPDFGANLLVCNPPYVRHHHLDSATKARLQKRTKSACGIRISGLSGLYSHFIALSHPWLAQDAISAWLIPSEFMAVNYGRPVKDYLLDRVTLLQIHRFDPQDSQFADALVSSAVVVFKNALPPADHHPILSYGGGLEKPMISRAIASDALRHEAKWTRYPKASSAAAKPAVQLGDLFEIKRGIATGDNKFFIMNRSQIRDHGLDLNFFTPILPPSRFIPDNEIAADRFGRPRLDKQLFLLNTRLPEQELAEKHPALKAYIDSGRDGAKPAANRYICQHRDPWYAQERREPAPLLCTYMGRGDRPFRFLLNYSKAIAGNVYLMLYPKPALADAFAQDPDLIRRVWGFLNAIDPEHLLGHGRVYGGGLHKLEPKELRSYPADALLKEMPSLSASKVSQQLPLALRTT